MSKEKIENACIKDFYLGFEDIPPGRNFIFAMKYETASGWGGVIKFNPLMIPTIFKNLKIDCIDELKGHYIQVKYKGVEIPCSIRSILGTKEEEWIKTDERYFGDDFLIEEGGSIYD